MKFSHKESLLYNTKVFAMDDDDSDDDQEEEEENVVNKTTYASLKRAWLAESNAPILLPFKSNVVRRFSNLIEERDAEIDRCERAANDGGDGTEMLLATIGREELNRMKYVLRSYLRTRIEKIQRFPVWSFVQQQVRHVRCGGYIYICVYYARDVFLRLCRRLCRRLFARRYHRARVMMFVRVAHRSFAVLPSLF